VTSPDSHIVLSLAAFCSVTDRASKTHFIKSSSSAYLLHQAQEADDDDNDKETEDGPGTH